MIKYKKNSELIYVALLAVATVSGIIWMFTNVGIDVTYQISMAYRYINGDVPFLEMWEPHQTSSFINIAFMWLYLKIAGTTTGIVLYLQVVGILIRGLMSLYLYKTLIKEISRVPSFGIALLFFMLSPKDYAIPEYGNMQVWFGTLIICLLVTHFRNSKVFYVLLISICTCCMVFSYPSCVLMYIPVVILFALYDKEKPARDIIVYTCGCVAIGFTFLAYHVLKLGFSTFWECLIGMLSLEPSHTVSVQSRLIRYGTNLLTVVAGIALINGLTYITVRIVDAIKRKQGTILSNATKRLLYYGISMIGYDIAFFVNILTAENRCAYGIIFINVIIVGIYEAKRLSDIKKRIYVIGTSISLTGLLATLMLTDLPLVVSLAYAVVAIGMSLIPIWEVISKSEATFVRRIMAVAGILFALLLMFRAMYVRTPIVSRGQICRTSLANISLVRVGPAKGIITDDESAVRERDGYADFNKYLRNTDKVMVIDGLVNSLAYLYTEAEIAVPSTMSDPKYSANMLEYFRLNPDKEPNVLAVAAYDGQIDYDVASNEWVYKWITEDFGATRVEKGTYWMFYFKD